MRKWSQRNLLRKHFVGDSHTGNNFTVILMEHEIHSYTMTATSTAIIGVTIKYYLSFF